MQLFYCPEIINNTFSFTEEEFRHIKVLRKNVADRVNIVDGIGNLYLVEIEKLTNKECLFKIISRQSNYNQRNHYLHIAIAPTKNIDRLEWFLEKATEIGIDQVTPIICSRSERKTIKPERLQKILVSAMKQSNQAYLPQFNPAISITSFFHQVEKLENQQLFIAHCEENRKEELALKYTKGHRCIILIGPEGDFSTEEINSAIQNGFQPITLGKNRLRTETAGIVACHTINLLNTDANKT